MGHPKIVTDLQMEAPHNPEEKVPIKLVEKKVGASLCLSVIIYA